MDRNNDQGKIVVMPCTRRGGTDASGKQQSASTADFINHMQDNDQLARISSRLANYAVSTDMELRRLKEASSSDEMDTVEAVARSLVRLSADIGANDMLRICYQVLIAARQGQAELIDQLQNHLEDEFMKFKSTLRVAT